MLAKATPLVLGLLGVIAAPFSYWCTYTSRACYGTWVDNVYEYFTQPLYDFATIFLVVAVVLIFVPKDIFRSWLKFAAWALPLAFIYIALTPVSNTGHWIDLFPYYRINAAHDAGIAFTILSLLLIAWKYVRAKKKRRAA